MWPLFALLGFHWFHDFQGLRGVFGIGGAIVNGARRVNIFWAGALGVAAGAARVFTCFEAVASCVFVIITFALFARVVVAFYLRCLTIFVGRLDMLFAPF